MFLISWYLVISLITFGISYADEYKVTDKVYLDLSKDNQELGRIVIGLFGKDAPKTVKNFKILATRGMKRKTYVGTRIHRIVKKFLIQGGDIVHNNGSGAISIFGKYFPDENLKLSHRGPGFVGMANLGPNTNGCQFYITAAPTPWLDGSHVIFGKVLTGQRVVHTLEMLPSDTNDVPLHNITITGSGLIKMDKSFEISDEAYDIWAWISASTVPLTLSFSILGVFQWFLSKLN